MNETTYTSVLATETSPEPTGAARDMTIDQLEYVTDLIAELREMSQRSKLSTLASLLALAQAEAAREVALRRR